MSVHARLELLEAAIVRRWLLMLTLMLTLTFTTLTQLTPTMYIFSECTVVQCHDDLGQLPGYPLRRYMTSRRVALPDDCVLCFILSAIWTPLWSTEAAW